MKGVSSTFDSAKFRSVLSYAPTSIVVVAGINEIGQPIGLTIGSFASVSLDPPLVGFFAGVNSQTWKSLSASGRFSVNVLSADQEQLCWRFAKEDDDKFSDVSWTASGGGSPILDGVVAWIDCVVESETVAGDHFFVLGRVESLGCNENDNDAMVFFRGKITNVHHEA